MRGSGIVLILSSSSLYRLSLFSLLSFPPLLAEIELARLVDELFGSAEVEMALAMRLGKRLEGIAAEYERV